MPNCPPYVKDHSSYPGDYIPPPEMEILVERLKERGKGLAAGALLNMNEYKDCFKIEVMVPGARREDIFIHIHDNILSIVVLHKECGDGKKKLKIHEFDNVCLERHILLPRKADTSFVCAEYKQGILRLHVPKTRHPSKHNDNQVVVY